MKATRAILCTIIPPLGLFFPATITYAAWHSAPLLLGLFVPSMACVFLSLYFMLTHSPKDEIKTWRDFFRRYK